MTAPKKNITSNNYRRQNDWQTLLGSWHWQWEHFIFRIDMDSTGASRILWFLLFGCIYAKGHPNNSVLSSSSSVPEANLLAERNYLHCLQSFTKCIVLPSVRSSDTCTMSSFVLSIQHCLIGLCFLFLRILHNNVCHSVNCHSFYESKPGLSRPQAHFLKKLGF